MIDTERYTDFFMELSELLESYGHNIDEIQSLHVGQGGTTIVKFVVADRFEHGYRPVVENGQKVLKAEYVPTMRRLAEVED